MAGAHSQLPPSSIWSDRKAGQTVCGQVGDEKMRVREGWGELLQRSPA